MVSLAKIVLKKKPRKQKISIVVLPGYILKADLNTQLGFQHSVVYPSTDSRNQNKYKRWLQSNQNSSDTDLFKQYINPMPELKQII